eukprot:gene19986-21946_t
MSDITGKNKVTSSSNSNFDESKSRMRIKLSDLTQVLEQQHTQDTQESIVESLEKLHVAGNAVRSAFAISTSGHDNTTKIMLQQLPKILKNDPYERSSSNARSVGKLAPVEKSKNPISQALRKATEKQSERERYWRKRRTDFMQRISGRTIENNNWKSNRMQQSLPKLESNAMFTHVTQNYAEFEAQETAKKGRREAFHRINRKGRASMMN